MVYQLNVPETSPVVSLSINKHGPDLNPYGQGLVGPAKDLCFSLMTQKESSYNSWCLLFMQFHSA